MEKDYPKNTEEEFSGVNGQIDAAVELNGEHVHRKLSLWKKESGLCVTYDKTGFQKGVLGPESLINLANQTNYWEEYKMSAIETAHSEFWKYSFSPKVVHLKAHPAKTASFLLKMHMPSTCPEPFPIASPHS